MCISSSGMSDKLYMKRQAGSTIRIKLLQCLRATSGWWWVREKFFRPLASKDARHSPSWAPGYCQPPGCQECEVQRACFQGPKKGGLILSGCLGLQIKPFLCSRSSLAGADGNDGWQWGSCREDVCVNWTLTGWVEAGIQGAGGKIVSHTMVCFTPTMSLSPCQPFRRGQQ